MTFQFSFANHFLTSNDFWIDQLSNNNRASKNKKCCYYVSKLIIDSEIG